ncbi:MAG: S1 RNA-binding domain-containing protein [Ruminococcus sp.]|nr:S1 RNA-binding domain-containing protein [Ruminococcus sp.]
MNYLPEGCIYNSQENQKSIASESGLRNSMISGTDIEVKAVSCSSEHDIIVEFQFGKGIIPRKEGAIGIADGTTRDIALISRVNKIVRCKVISMSQHSDGTINAVLSRKASQDECVRNYIRYLRVGDIIPAKVTHIEHFGAFVDIGCGLPSLIPIDAISVSRISDPSDRFTIGQMIKAAVKRIENDRVYLTHKELLGTWEQNTERFNIGETVSGIVRSIEEYGIFVELAPNLAGLAEPKEGVSVGDRVSVYIKSIIKEKMKVKLIIVDTCGTDENSEKPIEYFVESDHIDKWEFSPSVCAKAIRTVFR